MSRFFISIRILRALFLLLLGLSFVYSAQLERHRMIEEFPVGGVDPGQGFEGPPLPPPKVDPGPDAATLDLIVLDRDTGERLSATVSVNRGDQEPENDPYESYSLRMSANRHKGPIRFRELNYYFFTDGSFSVRVPSGTCTVEVCRGYEYTPTQQTFRLQKNQTVKATIYLKRWIDMAKQGWYSGDTHIHFERTGSNDDTLLTLTSARDIRYAFSLSMNTTGYALGREFESWGQAYGLGEKSIRKKGPYHLISGQEYRAGSLGHVTVLAEDYVPGAGPSIDDVDEAPSLGVIADQAHQLSGVIGFAHGGSYRREADALALTGKMDFLELLQFGGYRGLGLDGWYDFLNLGYRWPIVGASDFPYTRELGDCVTYVQADKEPTVREFSRALAGGRSFATSGPMIFLGVNGKGPGELITSEDAAIPLEVEVSVLSPLYPVRYVDIIWNGRVVSRQFDPKGRSRWEISERLKADRSGWVAVRAYEDAGSDAHTNPVYVYLKGKLPFADDACGQILARLESSIRGIPNREIQARLRELKEHLQRYRDTGNARGLALPGKLL